MDAGTNRNELDNSTIRYIRIAARRLVGRYGFNAGDVKDLEQDLILDLLKHLPDYDSRRAKLSTFVKMVVEQRVTAIIDAQKAKKRNYTLCVYSLNEEIYDDNGEPVQRIEMIATDDYLRATRRPRWTAEERMDLLIDLRRVGARLPLDLRWLVENLWMKTPAEISREMGIPRSTLNGRIEVLCITLRSYGLKDYL